MYNNQTSRCRKFACSLPHTAEDCTGLILRCAVWSMAILMRLRGGLCKLRNPQLALFLDSVPPPSTDQFLYAQIRATKDSSYRKLLGHIDIPTRLEIESVDHTRRLSRLINLYASWLYSLTNLNFYHSFYLVCKRKTWQESFVINF